MKYEVLDTEALMEFKFYDDNYTELLTLGLGGQNKKIVLGTKPYQCRFCGCKPPERTFGNRAHAVSRLLGNNNVTSLYECDTCNERFSIFEDDLGKMTLPFRSLAGTSGYKGAPKLHLEGSGSTQKQTMQFKEGVLHVSQDAGEVGLVEDEATQTLTLTYVKQPHRPLGVYKALCKSAFTLLPDDELQNFDELKLWLLQPDLITNQVYTNGDYICYSTFVPASKPFRQAVVSLHRRKEKIDSPYMSFFIATGNVSYQIFLPCPAKDDHLRGTQKIPHTYPHIFQLRPLLIRGRTQKNQIDLNSSEQTTKKSETITWTYGEKIKVK